MHHWMRKALLALGIVISKSALIADPNFIDFFILTRHHALHCNIASIFRIASRVQRGVTSYRTLCADRSLRIQFPGTRLEAEIARRQRADGTDVSGVA